VLSQVTRRSYSGPAGNEILPIRGYRDGREVHYGSGLGLDLFRLVVSPLQPGVVRLYLAQSERLPSCSIARGSQIVSRFFGS
jgi:hypothetical protein